MKASLGGGLLASDSHRHVRTRSAASSPAHGWTTRRRVAVLATLAVVLSALVAVAPQRSQPAVAASAVGIHGDRFVSDNAPVAWTPHVGDGSVGAIAEVGDWMVAGGNFSTVENPSRTTQFTRNFIFAFQKGTGTISTAFAPTLNGEVTSIVPAGDGRSVYIGGGFNTVNGSTYRNLVKMDVLTGAIDPQFDTPSFNGRVHEIMLQGDRLYVAGRFTTIDGTPNPLVAALDPVTGALIPDVNIDINTPRPNRPGSTLAISDADISPDGSRMVIIGNFTQVAGQERYQIAQLDLTTSPISLVNWQTTEYNDSCSGSFDSYMRDVEFSPDGSFFVVVTTGAFAGGYAARTLCDASARWETGATGSGLLPSWTNYTGGDTLLSVAITDSIVYQGGHERRMNNPYAADRPGRGSVRRDGLSSLDPRSGAVLSWNPGRDRGVGVQDFLVTEDGLWVGSDTTRIARWNYRGRIALLPLTNRAVPQEFTGALPGTVYSLGSDVGTPAEQDRLVAREFDGTTVQSSVEVPTTASLGDVRGAFMADGTLYTIVDEPPATAPVVCPAADTEWTADYFNNRELVPPSTGSGTIANAQFDINWGSGGPVGVGVGVDQFSIRFTRTINLPAPGNYRFDVGSDDGHRLFVTHDGTTTSFQRWVNQAYTVSSYNVTIADPCGVELVMEYYENGGGARASIAWPGEPQRERSLRKQSFNGTTFGAPETIDLRLLDADNPSGTIRGDNVDTAPGTDVSNQVNAITPPNLPNFGNFDIPNANGMFYDPVTGRLYFTSPQYTWSSGGTRTSPAGLGYRQFSTESDIVGAVRYQTAQSVAGLDWNQVRSMFLVGSDLYVADTDGDLTRWEWDHWAGTPVAGTGVVVSGPTIDGENWRARGAFVYVDSNATPPNLRPSAAVSGGCSGSVCTFDASASFDVDGTIESYVWDFGDGTGSLLTTEPIVQRLYLVDGTYPVTVTVTDNEGATDSAETTVDVTIPNLVPRVQINVDGSGFDYVFDADGSIDFDGSIVSYTWDFGDSSAPLTVSSEDPVAHTYAAPGDYVVTLTAVDNDGDPGTAQVTVQAFDPDATATVAFDAISSVNVNSSSPTVPMPSSVQVGDLLVLIGSFNRGDVTVSGPTGWTLLDSAVSGSFQTHAWTKVATPADAGANVSVAVTAATKTSLQLASYRVDGQPGSPSIGEFAVALDTESRTERTTPTVAVTVPGSVVVSYWAEKSLDSVGWTLPADVVERNVSVGEGNGRIVAAYADDGPLGAGVSGGHTAVAGGTANGRGMLWSIVVQPPGESVVNLPPTAEAAVACLSTFCEFDPAGSDDLDGSIVEYSWNFGDGTAPVVVATGEPVEHTYAAGGAYTASLTVTDDDGATATKELAVDVVVVNVAPIASIGVSGTGFDYTFDPSGSVDLDGSIVSYSWDFGDGTSPVVTATPDPVPHTYGAAGGYLVTLTVVDDVGEPGAAQLPITAFDPTTASTVAFVEASSVNTNSAQPTVQVPGSVQEGDLLVLIGSFNRSNVAVSGPTGWTSLDSAVGDSFQTHAWTRVATAADAGSAVPVGLSGSAKTGLHLVAYRLDGVPGSPTIGAHAVLLDNTSSTVRTTPVVDVTADGSTVVSYWADKSSDNTGWVVPTSVDLRDATAGSGGGRIVTAYADSGPVGVGPAGGVTATALGSANQRGIVWTIAIQP